jgi:O-antigen/teichoic acid export membrane protein
MLSAALAFVAVAGGLASLGMNTILVRELATAPQERGEILGTALAMRLTASSLIWLVCVVIAFGWRSHGVSYAVLLPLAALTLIAQSMDVVERQLQAGGELRSLAVIRSVAVLGSFGLRVVLILGEASLGAFALAGVCEFALIALGLAWRVSRREGGFRRWRFSTNRGRALLKEGLPLMMAGLAIQMQAYGDQIMMGAFSVGDELGQYAAALRIVGVCTFLPAIMQTVAAPEIARARRDDQGLYRRRLHGLYRLAMGVSLLTAVPLAVAGPMAIVWLFGDAYREAGGLLPLLALRLFLANLGVARGVFLTTEGMARFVLITAVVGAGGNVALNLVLIPAWGATGAIVASLLSCSLTTFGLEWMDRRARSNSRLMLAAMLRPWRTID